MIREFKYFAPRTLNDALKLLDKYQDDYKIVCGGQSILIMMRQGLVRPETVIDIKRITELGYIKGDARKGMKIGALTTHRTIEKSKVVQNSFSILAEMENRLASIQTRNWGTIGGNISHADPAGDPAPVLIALNASLTLARAGGERTLLVEDFFLDYFETALEAGEMLTEDARIVLGAAAPTPMRAKKAEKILIGKKITDNLLKEAGEIASTEAEPISDIHASAEYRRELVKVLVKRVGKEALARAKA
jgi:carbon-monoxide dehydrogenase medium subunit